MVVPLFLVGTPRVLWMSIKRTLENLGIGSRLQLIPITVRFSKDLQDLTLSAVTVLCSDRAFLPATRYHSLPSLCHFISFPHHPVRVILSRLYLYRVYLGIPGMITYYD